MARFGAAYTGIKSTSLSSSAVNTPLEIRSSARDIPVQKRRRNCGMNTMQWYHRSSLIVFDRSFEKGIGESVDIRYLNANRPCRGLLREKQQTHSKG